MIVDKSVEEEILTKKGKKSGRATIKGMVCTSFQIPRLKDISEKLNIPKDERSSKPFLCTSIEIYLRYKQELEKLQPSGKVYFQR
jgi:hypothetical protein